MPSPLHSSTQVLGAALAAATMRFQPVYAAGIAANVTTIGSGERQGARTLELRSVPHAIRLECDKSS